MRYAIVAVNKETHEVNTIELAYTEGYAITLLRATIKREYGTSKRNISTVIEQRYVDTEHYRYQVIELF